jgi:antitoxin FitA
MATLTIEIPEEKLKLLERRAIKLKLTPQELILASVEEILAHAEQDLQTAIDHILEKNAELYRRLA